MRPQEAAFNFGPELSGVLLLPLAVWLVHQFAELPQYRLQGPQQQPTTVDDMICSSYKSQLQKYAAKWPPPSLANHLMLVSWQRVMVLQTAECGMRRR